MEARENILSIIYYFQISHFLPFQEFCIEVFCQDLRNRCNVMNLISMILFPKNSNMQER